MRGSTSDCTSFTRIPHPRLGRAQAGETVFISSTGERIRKNVSERQGTPIILLYGGLRQFTRLKYIPLVLFVKPLEKFCAYRRWRGCIPGQEETAEDIWHGDKC